MQLHKAVTKSILPVIRTARSGVNPCTGPPLSFCIFPHSCCLQTNRYFTPNHGGNVPITQEIRSFLQIKNIKAQSGPTCFKCENIFPKPKLIGRPRKNDDSTRTLFINKTTGDFFCTASGRSGTWTELRNFVKNSTPSNVTATSELPQTSVEEKRDLQKIEHIWQSVLSLSEVSDLTREEILAKFGLNVIPLSDLEMYDVRLGKDMDAVIVPWFSNTNIAGCGKPSSKGVPVGVKMFFIPKSNDSHQGEVVHLPTGSYRSMLGLSHVPANAKKVVLTMNEFDAIAINSSSLKHRAVSLPCGITYLPLEVLPFLEQFTEIILWFNNNQISWEAARQFAKKLDEKRCRLVRPTAGTPNPLQALSKNLDIDDIISSAVSAEIRNIVSFTDLRGFVKDELMNCDTVCGVRWTRFPKLLENLKGHRRGELTVLTGPTGSGKTTFMSEYSLDLAMQGVSTLWGSFEIQNVRLLKTMMKQFARSRLEKQMTDFDGVAEKFQTLPIHFMTYNGPQTMKDVIHTMRQAAYVHDIQHIVIDNLQFMMGSMPKNNDRFMVQDMLISEFRNFATTEHIHVTIVIHPRKEDIGTPLQISSIFGTAKATQEADNVLILQNVTSMNERSPYKHSYIEIVKNRYDGELGKIALRFDKNTLCMSKPPNVDGELEKEVRKSVKLVQDEDSVKYNGDGVVVTEERLTAADVPVWLKDWKKDSE